MAHQEDDRSPEGDSSPSAAIPSVCLFCGLPVEKAKRGGVRQFCDARHRSAYRNAQVQAAIQEARAALSEARDEMARLSARLDGAEQLLDRFTQRVHRIAQR
jgi:hypothetical protein